MTLIAVKQGRCSVFGQDHFTRSTPKAHYAATFVPFKPAYTRSALAKHELNSRTQHSISRVQTCRSLQRATLLPITATFWVLKGAAEHNRLGSNTYRRLNLGLMAWAAINLALLASETSALTSWCFSVQVAFYAATAVVGGYAWASSSGFAPTGRQVIDGFLGDVQALFNNKTFLSGLLALLSVAAVAVGSLILNQPLTYFHPSEFRLGAGWLGKMAMRSYAANVLFAAVVMTTLKDALDRGRHTASTFKILAKAAVATAVAEIAIFASTGCTSGIIREVVFGGIMTSYLLKPKTP
ncbi:hypothetical protein WJX75_007829 [Coccomyxa subellipsoidea]|uniref:Uncharacterized protein n=1 Tax=Coccomyxa subellipsoidea TaxID=248742 RepID=A0ABR2Z4J5_9CHLO